MDDYIKKCTVKFLKECKKAGYTIDDVIKELEG